MKIGELASATSTKVETVRYYERSGCCRHPHGQAPITVPMAMII
jgi:DNA-binding transcriptional MerR regulator